MKKFLPDDKKNVFGRAKKFRVALTDLPDEKLRKLVRRAAKSVPVPGDLESKLWSLVRKQL